MADSGATQDLSSSELEFPSMSMEGGENVEEIEESQRKQHFEQIAEGLQHLEAQIKGEVARVSSVSARASCSVVC